MVVPAAVVDGDERHAGFDQPPREQAPLAEPVAAVALAGAVRLAADAEGVTVREGLAGRRRIPWRAVERVRVDSRDRLGLRQTALEIDEGSTLHLFTAADLGADPHEVAAALAQLRTGR